MEEVNGRKKIGVVGLAKGWSSNRLADAVENLTGYRCLVELDRVVFDVEGGKVLQDGVDITALDALIVKKIAASYSPELMDRLEVLRFLYRNGLPIFSNPDAMGRSIDRLSCTAMLRIGKIPMPPTVVTESTAEAIRAVKRFGQAILKPLYTSKARGMDLVEENSDLRDKIEDFRQRGNRLIYVQKMMDLPGRDLGLTFLGGKYLATYARVKNGDSWNTTIRTGGRYEPHEPSEDIIELAERAQSLFGLDFTCVDVAETREGPVVFEVSAFGGFRGLREAHGIEAADIYAKYVLEKIGR